MIQVKNCRKSVLFLTALNYISQLRHCHIIASQCPMATSFLEWRTAVISPINCLVVTGASRRAWCSLQCHDNLLCLAFTFTCDPQCVCQICSAITTANANASRVLFLRRSSILYNIPPPTNLLVHVWLSGGLYPGHVLDVLFDVDPPAFGSNSLAMMLSPGTELQQDPDAYALFFTMNLASGGTERMSKVHGKEDRETTEPHFSFVANNSFHVVILTGVEDFQIYINSQIYCTFRHRLHDLETIQHLHFQPYMQLMISKLSF